MPCEQPQLPKKAVKSSRSYAVHPACEKCHKLCPETFFAFLPTHGFTALATRCCYAHQINWKFLVGTRKGKINLTTRSRVAAVQKRGVWAALSM